MANIKKVCSKCGKTISVDRFEYCCPLCGEFFEDMDNSQVLQHHADLETNERVEELREEIRRQRKSANRDGLITWLKALGISYVVMMVLSFFSLGSSDGGTALAIIMFVGMGGVALVGPLIPIINSIRYNGKLNDEIAKIDGTRVEEKGRFNGISILSTINCVLMVLPLLVAISLVIDPKIAFQYVHFGWVIGVICGCALIIVILALISINLFGKGYYEAAGQNQKGNIIRAKGYISIVGVVLSIILMLVGFFSIPNKTISISNTQEFNVLANMPYAGECNYILEADLDFEGASSIGYGSIKTFTGVFDGNGHYIKNLNISKESVSYRGGNESGYTPEVMGLVLYNRGEIKNLGFENCTIETFISGGNTNSFGILAGQNAGKIDNCIFIDTYAKYYHNHSYYSKKYNVLNCDDDFGYIVGRNAIGDRATYSNTRIYGEITNIIIRFENENQEFLTKSPSGNYDKEDENILNNISTTENVTVVDKIGFVKQQ